MPREVEDCVDALMADPKFKPRKEGQTKREAAYAVCTAQYQESHKKARGEGQGVGGKRQGMGGPAYCVCPKCGHRAKHKANQPCAEQKCPECGAAMRPQEQKSFSMRITKATVRDGGMYWQGAISDDDWDKEDERLSLEIFRDFESQHKAQHSDYQPPYVSLAHYDRMQDGSGEIGTIERIWTDGHEFYNDGWFHPTKLGRRVFEVVKAELERQQAGEEIENPVRFSIGFWDYTPYDARWEGNPPRRVYLKGEYEHAALTRVPINARSHFTQLTEKSMTTQREDALSIVGEDFEDDVDELDKKQPIGKSEADGLITKSEDEEESPLTAEQDIDLRILLEKSGMEKSEIVEKAWDYSYKKSLPDSAYAWVEHGAGCEKQDGKTPQKCRHLPYKDKGGAIDCGHVRAALQAIGGARTGKKMSVPSGVKGKLQKALKSCQKGKAEYLDTELPEYEAGRMDGFNAALDMMTSDEEVTDMEDKDETKQPEVKAEVDVDAVIEAVKPKESEKPEQKAEVEPPDDIDSHVTLLRQIIAAEGAGRSKKLEGAEAVLRSLAVQVSKAINDTTPASPEDVANSVKSQMEDALRPLMDKVAVLEEAVLGQKGDAPKSKALTFAQEPFQISPTASFLAAQETGGPAGENSPLTKMINASVGLPEEFKRQQVL